MHHCDRPRENAKHVPASITARGLAFHVFADPRPRNPRPAPGWTCPAPPPTVTQTVRIPYKGPK